MKNPVFWFLGMSVGANVVLALLLLRPPPAASSTRVDSRDPVAAAAAKSALSSAAAAGQSAAKETTAPVTASTTTVAGLATRLRTARTDDEIRATIADLQAAGVPSNVIRAMVSELLRVRFAAREPTMPFWRRNSPTPEFVAATQALAAERRALLENLLGPDGTPAATMDPRQRDLRYGPVSDEKLNAIVRIERDYDELRAKAFAETGAGVGRIGSTIQQQRLMDEEKLRDLATILSPEELEQYELRNTLLANTVMRHVSSITVSAGEFAALHRLQKQLEADFPVPATPSNQTDIDAYLARQAGQLKRHAELRAVLPDDRFYRYLENADPNYSALARFAAQQPTMTPEQTYRVYQLQTELQAALTVTGKSSNAAPPDIRSYETRLVEIIGPTAAAADKKQGNGRMFLTPPRTSGPGGG
ncbi:MAG: hypothetical protein C0518_03740 [Opitutus sp.]|nr:hypothetical protein [Opitutus sp.]